MSTWFSNICIGMDPEGYGALLGEVSFTCSRVSRLRHHEADLLQNISTADFQSPQAFRSLGSYVYEA